MTKREALRRAEALIKAFGYHDVIDTIRELPTAERVGKWIDEGTNYSCSECHRGCWVNSDYCPWCGARMVRGR